MKRQLIWMLALALLLPALAAGAQDEGQSQGPAPQEDSGKPPAAAKGESKEHPMLSKHFLDTLEKRLGLAADQASDVQDAISEAKDDLQDAFDEVQKAQKEMQALENDLRKQIRAVLTDEQRKIFDKMEGTRPQGQPPRPAPQPEPAAPDGSDGQE